MASNCHNPPKIKEHSSHEEKVKERIQNQNYKSRCLSIHLNHLRPTSSNSIYELDCNSLPNCQPKSDNKIPLIMRGGVRKRPFSETEEQIDSNQPNLDLSLSLSPPGSGSSSRHQNGDELSNIILSSHSCTPLSSASTQRSCTSVTLYKGSTEELLESGGADDTHSLVVMGCGRCLMYIMVSEADPKCPKCKTSALIDIFRRAKRVGKSENSCFKSD